MFVAAPSETSNTGRLNYKVGMHCQEELINIRSFMFWGDFVATPEAEMMREISGFASENLGIISDRF